MKRFLTLILALAVSFAASAQCTVSGTPGNAEGVFPTPSNIPCIERNVFYDFTLQLKNFDTITLTVPLLGAVNAAVISTTIDSITNFPCGITWESDSTTFDPLETGCIRVYGTTSEPVGQYPTGIYITMVVDVPQLGVQPISGELKDLADQGGVATDYNYVSRVINAGDNCPAINQNASANATAGNCPGLGVIINGNTAFCGGSETLTAVAQYEVGTVSYAWSTSDTTASISVNTSGTYTVTVTDDNGTATESITVDANTSPVAGFTSSVNGLTVDFTNTSTTADSYSWDFGDGAGTSTATDPSYTYFADGTYSVTLTATNNCGTDSATASVTVATPPCIVVAPTNPGVYPHPDSVTCIERTLPYDFTLQVKAFDTLASAFGFDILADTMVIDSLVNFPCGINWNANKLVYLPGETGCIRVSGTSREIVDQYRLGIYMTISLSIPGIGGQTFSGELNDLQAQLEQLTGTPLGYDFKYVSRVINSGDNCPARDVNTDAVASGDICPPLGVVINGTPTICDGNATTLTAVARYETGSATFQWSDNSTNAALTVTAADTYTVTVTDQTGTATASVTVNTGSKPEAGFTAVPTVGIVTVNNTSTGATSYLWNFGDPGSGSNNTSTLPAPSHTYNSNGVKTITLIVTNSCGADTSVQTVTIEGVGINSVEYDLSFEMFPNPSNGTVALQFSGEGREVYDLNIFDLSGKIVYSERIASSTGSVVKQLNLSDLAKGVYTLRLNSEKGFGVKKLILN